MSLVSKPVPIYTNSSHRTIHFHAPLFPLTIPLCPLHLFTHTRKVGDIAALTEFGALDNNLLLHLKLITPHLLLILGHKRP